MAIIKVGNANRPFPEAETRLSENLRSLVSGSFSYSLFAL